MQNDDVIWSIIKNSFCSFKAKIAQREKAFCRNEYNVTGLCNRVSCPLANSRYATVKEIDGICYLYMKTIERAHTPNKLWERVKLSKSYTEALQQIDKHLLYWPGHIKHRAKQRLTKIRQYLIRMRKLRSKVTRKLVPIKPKERKVQASKERRAEKMAKVDLVVKSKLLENLKSGTYDQIIKIDPDFAKVLEEEQDLSEEDEEEEEKEEGEEEIEFVDEYIAEDDESDIEDYGKEFEFEEEDEGFNEEEEEEEIEQTKSKKRARDNDDSPSPPPKKQKPKRAHVSIEYEHEIESRELEK